MPSLNWGMVPDGGAFESLMHAILYAKDSTTVLFGRPGKDAGQDARSADGTAVYQAKYRQGLNMDGAIALALEELDKIKNYRQPSHANHTHWHNAQRWVLVANFSINPNDDAKWKSQVVPAFHQEGLAAEYWHIDILEGKLAQHPEIRDVFFDGENRILVGLKEAHDLLSAECIGSLSLDIPMVGRDGELELIESFASSGEKRVLPVIGPGGIGKSRLLYEGLVSLAQDGWRVLWALPGTMARSSQWFRLLNGAQKTCVALDTPDDPALLRAVIEQLTTVERRNWRVIVAYRSEKAQALQRFNAHKHVHEQIRLTPLNEPNSHALVNSCLQNTAQPSWLHSVYSFTNGVPGWLCLIGELAKRGTLSGLPTSVDEIAALYVDSCLHELGDTNREQGRTLLRWLALWGTLAVDGRDSEIVELSFLAEQGIPEVTTREMLRRFVDAGIVRNWGMRKRLYAVEPLIVRHHILSNWLYRETEDGYEVSREGRQLVTLIVEGRVPAADSALHTLSQLARSRLEETEASIFLKPIFDVIAALASEGDTLDQYRIAGLIENAGAADPEGALDILSNIRKSPKQEVTASVPNMGEQTFTHDILLATLPWTLFQLAEHISSPVVAGRYLDEFRQLVALEDQGNLKATGGKTPRTLLKRILIGSSKADIFAQPAHDLVVAGLTASDAWPFVGLVAECLLNPVRETVEWVAHWTMTITKRPMAPDSREWILAAHIREEIFGALQNCPGAEFRGPLWRVLADSHHAFHHTVLQGKVKGPVNVSYRQVLVDDLKTCATILGSPPVSMTIAEATHARKMWSWYLEYGKDDDLVGLARDCENIYASLSSWHLHDFFRFATEEELAPETTRIADVLLKASDPDAFMAFFEEAEQYLDAARHAQDMADEWRISSLADACADRFMFDDSAPMNPLTEFALGVLGQPNPPNPLAWRFVTRLCRRHLFDAKRQGETAVATALSALLSATTDESRLLRELYSNVHPSSTGMLTKVEFDRLLEHETDFSVRDWFFLLGPFYALDAGLVQGQLRGRLNASPNDAAETSQCMTNFILSTHLTALRYDWMSEQMPVGWIVDMITAFGLDGGLLGMHQLEWMRDQSSFRLSMVQLTALIRSRCELEQNVKPYESFEIVPHNFAIRDWVVFDATQDTEMDAFRDLCHLALGSTFTAIYWMPKYLCQIDPSGQHVAAFVRQYLVGTPDITGDALGRLGLLASGYENDSSQWDAIAGPICEKAVTLPRAERERVYFGLSRKETGVMISMPGQVPDYYVRACEKATRLRDTEPSDSPLIDYREWALRRADAEFKEQQEWAEELADE
jgi:hypothetical protein